MENTPAVYQLVHDMTNKLAAVTGWYDLNERELALQALINCYELLIQLMILLEAYQ